MVHSCISTRKCNEALCKTAVNLNITRQFMFAFLILVLFAFLTPLVVMADETKTAPPALAAPSAAAAAVPAATDASKPTDTPAAATTPAAPATPPDVKPVLNTGDTAWMLISSALVLLMIPGLALFYGGMVRQKNVLSTFMHSFVAMGIVGVQWAVVGYSLSFGG